MVNSVLHMSPKTKKTKKKTKNKQTPDPRTSLVRVKKNMSLTEFRGL